MQKTLNSYEGKGAKKEGKKQMLVFVIMRSRVSVNSKIASDHVLYKVCAVSICEGPTEKNSDFFSI